MKSHCNEHNELPKCTADYTAVRIYHGIIVNIAGAAYHKLSPIVRKHSNILVKVN